MGGAGHSPREVEWLTRWLMTLRSVTVTTLLRVAMIASSTIALPEVRAVISSASRIGTPEDTSVPRVRQKRATAILRRTEPSTGMRSIAPSMCRRPLYVLW